MDRGKWEKTLTCFQASARGYLARNEIRGARGDFEDIVKEIDGGSTHVEWKETVVPVPHFTDTDSPLLRPSSFAGKHSDARLDVCASPQSPSAAAAAASSPSSSSSVSAAAPLSEERGDPCVLLEKIEAERDDSHTRGRASLSKHWIQSGNVTVAGVSQIESTEVEKDGDSTTVWSSLELDTTFGHSHKAPRQLGLAQEVPCTPEALRLHRNALTMELVWLQQAIDSRKKYLSLKDRLSVS